MALYQSLSFGSDKTTVIFDIGVAYTKCGYAAENAPRSIVPSKAPNRTKLSGPQADTDDSTNVYDYQNEDELYKKLVDFIHHLYFRHLMVNPKERKVVVVESILAPTVFRNTLARVLFKHFEVPSVLFAPSHLVTLFTLGISSGLVIDAGYAETVVLPIYEGIPLIKAWQSIPLAGKAIHDNLRARLLETATVKTDAQVEKPLSAVLETIPEHVLEDIKVRCCFVTKLERGRAVQAVSQGRAEPDSLPDPPPGVEYPLDGGTILFVEGKLREAACEVLFEQDNEEKSVATLILDSLLKCPIDLRKELAGSLVVVGGTAQLPGFRKRLQTELADLLARPVYEPLKSVAFRFHNPPAKPNYTAWLGGAIFGGLEVLASRSVSKEAYQLSPVLPDWCSLDQPVEREDKPVLKGSAAAPAPSATATAR